MSDGQARCAQRAALRVRAALKPLRRMLKGVIGRAAPGTRRINVNVNVKSRVSGGMAGWVRLRGTP
jgi:hypothetical protein